MSWPWRRRARWVHSTRESQLRAWRQRRGVGSMRQQQRWRQARGVHSTGQPWRQQRRVQVGSSNPPQSVPRGVHSSRP